MSVVPGHANKVFVPYGTLLPKESAPRAAGHVLIHASVNSITDNYIELDRDLLEHERDLEGDRDQVESLTEELEDAKLDAEKSKKSLAGRRIKWDYMIYVSLSLTNTEVQVCLTDTRSISRQALGCTLPPPLYSLARTKKTGVAFLEVTHTSSSS